MPFTIDQFYAVFAAYNHAVWPAQYALFALAAFAVYFAALPLPAVVAAAAIIALRSWVAAVHELHVPVLRL
ncbi:MAG TPA: hypothetical protein VFN37_07770 [Candidatus Baltobacteraceae bacterium]|nr:hypothetical protein [Candidatus Baltobacteraceae bacterium]